MTPDHTRPDPWTIIIPVKDTRVAKTRLSALGKPVRATLALAFAQDSVAAALACELVHEVMVVTNDRTAERVLADLGARVIRDAPDAGLNAAVEHGVGMARRLDPDAAVAAMLGDLPALRGEDLHLAFAAGSRFRHWFVADADGTGTTLLAAVTGVEPAPSFGPRSRRDHHLAGAADIDAPGLVRLRRDVDTVDHLWQAVRLGVGPHTRRALVDVDLAMRPAGIA